MGSFTIDGGAAGAMSLGKGIGSAIKAAALADQYKSDAYLSTMGKVKNMEEARGLQMTNQHRMNVDSELERTPDISPFRRAQMIAFKLAGPQYMDNFSKSGETEQGIEHREAVIKNPALALPVAQAHFATSGKAPFDNVSDTGYSINQMTGEQSVAHPGMAKLFSAVEGALANQRNASAGESGARAERVRSGLDRTVTTTDDTGRPMVTALPTGGGVVQIAPAKATTSGVDATNAKSYNALVSQVEKDMPGASDDKVQAEVEKRWARRVNVMFPNKNPAPAAAAPTMEPSIPQGYTYAGKDKKTGKTVVKDASGKLFIME